MHTCLKKAVTEAATGGQQLHGVSGAQGEEEATRTGGGARTRDGLGVPVHEGRRRPKSVHEAGTEDLEAEVEAEAAVRAMATAAPLLGNVGATREVVERHQGPQHQGREKDVRPV